MPRRVPSFGSHALKCGSVSLSATVEDAQHGVIDLFPTLQSGLFNYSVFSKLIWGIYTPKSSTSQRLSSMQTATLDFYMIRDLR